MYTERISSCDGILKYKLKVGLVIGCAKTLNEATVYRVFHDLWTLLQEVISLVFVIKIVHINMCPILDGCGVMTA